MVVTAPLSTTHKLMVAPPLRLHVAGRSMAPLLRPGDIITLATMTSAAPAGLWPGLLVVMASTGARPPYVHRLLAAPASKESCLLTKGDAVRYVDGGLGPGALLGIVVRVERGEDTLELNTPAQRRLARIVAQLSWSGARLHAARRWRLATAVHRGIALLDHLAWRLG